MKQSSITSIIRCAILLGGLAASAIIHAQPVIHDVYPDGSRLLQSTNMLSFGATSSGPDINPSGITVTLNSTNLRGQNLVTNLTATNGLVVTGTVAERSVTAPLLTNSLSYTAVIIVTDANGGSATNTVKFDTLQPDFSFEAEDFDYDNGQFIDNAQPGSYAGLNATEGVDTHKGNPTAGGNAYRNSGLSTEKTDDKSREIYITTGWLDYNVGFNDGGNWGNYTRTYPAGVYNVYMRGASGAGGGGTATLGFVTSGVGTPSQTTTTLGTFTIPPTGGWQTYTWVPLKDAGGNIVRVSSGGVQTLRVTVGGGYNANFYAFFLADTNLPTIHNISPDGTKIYQPTNTFSFIASSAATISPSSITVQFSSTNLLGQTVVTNLTSTNGLVITGTATDRNVSIALTGGNKFYKAVIHVTDANNNSADATATFNTLNPAYTFEAEDFDHDNGQFFENPQTNAYAGLGGTEGVDAHHLHLGGTYRTSGYYNEKTDDQVRPQYDGTGFTDYNLGFNDGTYWANYSRTYPAGTYNVCMRGANANGSSGSATLALVTSGVGTASQTTTNLGTFVIPPTGGWQTYTWIPLKDAGGNLVKFTGGSVKTIRVTAGGGFNPNFYALFPADTNLPAINNVYPDGTSLFQATNKLSFSAVSPAGIATGNITVTLNGVNISPSLSFSGTSISRSVSYTGLSANKTYTAVINIIDGNGNSASTTVNFDTFKPRYTWEAEDYDHSNGQFFDNPQVNAYASLSPAADVDWHDVNNGGGGFPYRPNGSAQESCGDIARAQFIGGTTDYNISNFGGNEWGNYTRHYPPGTYNVWGRFGAGAGSCTATLSRVTGGWGTTNQTTSFLGTFAVALSDWQIYTWSPLKDAGGNLVNVTLTGSTNTLQLGHGTGPDSNVNFLMLVPSTVLTATRIGGNISLAIQTQTGFTYQIQYKNSLTDPSWTSLGSPITGNDTVQTVNDLITGSSRFYRTQITF
ncbi:MAG: hypothetical protein JWQ71_592 [Pedosphaera sp.]|nr:hypothetical protein [Pedosphaera sp.]